MYLGKSWARSRPQPPPGPAQAAAEAASPAAPPSWRDRGAGRDSPPGSSHGRPRSPRGSPGAGAEPGAAGLLCPPQPSAGDGGPHSRCRPAPRRPHTRRVDYASQGAPRPGGGAGHCGTCSPDLDSLPAR